MLNGWRFQQVGLHRVWRYKLWMMIRRGHMDNKLLRVNHRGQLLSPVWKKKKKKTCKNHWDTSDITLDLRGYNWVHLTHRPQCTVTLNSNFAILKTWNRCQLDNYWSFGFAKESRRVLAIFKDIFLRNKFLSNVKWFYGKKTQNWEGNLYLTENRWKEMWCAEDQIQLYVSCKKSIFRFELWLSSYSQNIIFFFKLLPILHIHKNRNYSSMIGNRQTNCFYPMNLWQGHVRNVLFHSCQLWAAMTKQSYIYSKRRFLIYGELFGLWCATLLCLILK